jgi:hypothetical protein
MAHQAFATASAQGAQGGGDRPGRPRDLDFRVKGTSRYRPFVSSLAQHTMAFDRSQCCCSRATHTSTGPDNRSGSRAPVPAFLRHHHQRVLIRRLELSPFYGVPNLRRSWCTADPRGEMAPQTHRDSRRPCWDDGPNFGVHWPDSGRLTTGWQSVLVGAAEHDLVSWDRGSAEESS